MSKESTHWVLLATSIVAGGAAVIGSLVDGESVVAVILAAVFSSSATMEVRTAFDLRRKAKHYGSAKS
jgi:uncharacterized membrane protein HdeD (DUF308 family)